MLDLKYDFIEMMACPSGCLNGGAQIVAENRILTKALLGKVKILHDKHVVVDSAMFYALMFRGNTQDAVILKERADEGIKAMRSMLINRYHYMRSYMIPASTGGRRLGSARTTAGSSLDAL